MGGVDCNKLVESIIWVKYDERLIFERVSSQVRWEGLEEKQGLIGK